MDKDRDRQLNEPSEPAVITSGMEAMSDVMVTMHELAAEAHIAQQNMKRSLLKAGFHPIEIKVRGRSKHVVTREEADRFLVAHNTPSVVVQKLKPAVPRAVGGVYVVIPDPELRPSRLKVGWTEDFNIRLTGHRTIAPILVVLRRYVTTAKWTEPMALAVVAKFGHSISDEVFDVDDVDGAVELLDAQFNNINVMPIGEKSEAVGQN